MTESAETKPKIAYIVFSVIFLVGIITSLFLFYSILFRKQLDISDDEKRTLQKIPIFSFSSFWDKSYQQKMEESVGDQLLFSQQIKYGTKQFYYYFTNQFANLDSSLEKIEEKRKTNEHRYAFQSFQDTKQKPRELKEIVQSLHTKKRRQFKSFHGGRKQTN